MPGRRNLPGGGGRDLPASADGQPEYRHHGITIDWTTVPTVAVKGVTEDGWEVLVGDQYLPYGTVLAKITATGLYGPYDDGAADGRQTLARGNCCILNYTKIKPAYDEGIEFHQDYAGGVFEGGSVYTSRLHKVDTGAFVAATQTEIEAAFPRLRFVA